MIETQDARVRVMSASSALGLLGRASAGRPEVLVRSDEPVSFELEAFLTRQLATTSAPSPGADVVAPLPFATLGALAPGRPWPVDLALLLLQRVATLLDAADAAGLVLGTFTPWCVVLHGRHLTLARHDPRAGLDPAYIAPEQLQGGTSVDGRASQYGLARLAGSLLGCDTHERGLLGALGWRPLRGDRGAGVALGADDVREVRLVLLVARNPDPNRRFRTCTDLVAALGIACGAWVLDSQAEADPGARWLTAAPAPATARGLGVAGGMLSVAVVAGAMGWYAARRPVAVPPELVNDTALPHFVADAAPGTPAATDPRALGARAPVRGVPAVRADSASSDATRRVDPAGTGRGTATADVHERLKPLVPMALSVALPRIDARPDTHRGTTRPGEFDANGIAQALRRETSSAEPAEVRPPAAAASDEPAEAVPMLLENTGSLPYPANLLQTRVRGEVMARFVVDRDGRVDPATFEIVESSHPAFSDAVRAALGQLRYRPAERDGHRIRVMVQQPFRFAPRH